MGVGIMARRRLLTEAMWTKIGPLLPEMKSGPKGGRPWRGNREVLEGILWVLRTGAAWADLPEEYPSPSTCWRRLRRWEEEGVWLEVWRSFLAQLDQKGTLEWQESFLDASFAPAKGGRCRGRNQAGQGHEVDGGGRRPGSSSGKPTYLGVAGGSHPCGSPPRRHRRVSQSG